MENYDLQVLEQIASMIVGLADQKISQSTHIGEIEQQLRLLLQLLGRECVRIILEKRGKPQGKEIACDCGGKLRYQRQRAAMVLSVFGRVRYQRAYYSGCGCGKGCAPVDERLRLQPGSVTLGLADLLALSGIQFSYKEAEKWLQEFLLFDISENTIRKVTERMGEVQQQMEEEWITQSQDEDWLQERLREEVPVPETLYCAIDAAKTRIEPRKQPKEAHEDWRDMKALVWFETQAVTVSQRNPRQQQKAERQEVPLRAINKRYACDIVEAEQFGKLLWATACQVRAEHARRLVFLGDGAPWIWNLVQTYFPQAIQIVDWYHAEEHLESVARAAFSDPEQAEAWLKQTKQALWEGAVEEVILACRALAERCPEAARNVHYFTSNCERMRYDRFRKMGMMIGSGVIESGCKQIVTQRLKLPGAQWLLEGAVKTAKARAAWLSDQWQPLFQRYADLPLAS